MNNEPGEKPTKQKDKPESPVFRSTLEDQVRQSTSEALLAAFTALETIELHIYSPWTGSMLLEAFEDNARMLGGDIEAGTQEFLWCWTDAITRVTKRMEAYHLVLKQIEGMRS